MGTSYRAWPIDPTRGAREAEEGLVETRRAMIADGARAVDLDQSGDELGAIVEALGLDDPFTSDELDADEVRRLARTLKPMTWTRVVELAETLGIAAAVCNDDYVRPYYELFRDLVLAAAQAGHHVGIESS